MDSIKVRGYLRTHVLGLVAIFVALTGTAVAQSGSGPTASSSAVSNAKFKKLKQRVTALETKLNSPVTGDVSGVFPNLTINNNAVTSAKIADNAVSTAKIADNAVTTGKVANNAVTQAKLATNSVGAAQLKDTVERDGTQSLVGANSSSLLGASCNAGEDLIVGGGVWDTTVPTVAISQSFRFLGGWFVRASNASGADHNFTPISWCIPQ